jgi:hypothetical protein
MAAQPRFILSWRKHDKAKGSRGINTLIVERNWPVLRLRPKKINSVFVAVILTRDVYGCKGA